LANKTHRLQKVFIAGDPKYQGQVITIVTFYFVRSLLL